MLGVLLIDKPEGVTSHDVVGMLRRRLGTRRIGHAGTLDPLATGLLVMAVGPATRFLQYLPLEPKEYVGVFRFGETTATYDSEGEVVLRREVPSDLGGVVEGALGGFRGSIEQLPPMFSAVKVGGQPLYKSARKGEEVERQTRRVYVSAFEVLGVEGADVEVRIVCSGGTYVRTLAHDLGEAVGCGSHVVDLRRTQVGKFVVADGVEPGAASAELLLPLSEALPPLPMVSLNRGQVDHVRNGRPVVLRSEPPGSTVGFLDEDGNVVGIGRVEGMKAHPECVLPLEAYAVADY